VFAQLHFLSKEVSYLKLQPWLPSQHLSPSPIHLLYLFIACCLPRIVSSMTAVFWVGFVHSYGP
jgi:hypothetical protein